MVGQLRCLCVLLVQSAPVLCKCEQCHTRLSVESIAENHILLTERSTAQSLSH
jgi:hypothetical protein